MSKTKTVKPIPVPSKGTFLKPGVKTETFLHSIGQDAESVGVRDVSADPSLVLAPVAVPDKKSVKGTPAASKNNKEKTAAPAKANPETVTDSSEKARNNTVLLPNLSNEDYITFKACLNVYEGSNKDAYKRIIELFVEDVKKTVSEEDFEFAMQYERRQLAKKIKRQKEKAVEKNPEKGA